MDKNIVWKWLLLVALVIMSAAVLSGGINLGIDLNGGTSFTLEIDRDDLQKQIRESAEEGEELSPQEAERQAARRLKEARQQAMEVIGNRVDGMGIANATVYVTGEDRIVLELPGIDTESRDRVRNILNKVAKLTFQLVHEENAQLVSDVLDSGDAPPGYERGSLPLERRAGKLVEVPCFIKLDEEKTIDGNSAETPEQIAARRRAVARFGNPPAYTDFMLMKQVVPGGSKEGYRPYYIERRVQMRGDHISDAGARITEMGGNIVSLAFSGPGKKTFGDVTEAYSPNGSKNRGKDGRQLAVIMDGRLYSAPVLQTAIFDGRAQIEGSFTQDEAVHLSNVLRAGALPVKVNVLQEQTIDPTLGKDSVESGKRAIMAAGVVVLVFMVLYYLVSGIVADIAMIFTMILLPLGMVCVAGFLGIFAETGGATGDWGDAFALPVLTLPGIAGILLTIGMAVDANVLIFERMREEFRTDKRTWAAVNAGYDRAFVTILDANVTTLLTGIILFLFGSGAIRGFAVTMCGGILVSMYAALVVTRMIFTTFVPKKGTAAIRMLSILPDKVNINFVGKRGIAVVFSILVIGGSWGMFAKNVSEDPTRILGVDLLGGTTQTYNLPEGVSEGPDVGVVRTALTEAGVNDAKIQYQGNIQGTESYLVVTAADEFADTVRDVILNKPGSLGLTAETAGFTFRDQMQVGSQIGSEMRTRAISSIVIALIVMILYISWRFQFGFALGAIAALAHDVLVTVGVYCLLGRQLNLTIIAALLTIVGYSVNDTIVVFDRIREDLKNSGGKSFDILANMSINRTLSRTILTSFTTLLVTGLLLFLGGGAINDFALALCIGVLVGTYSSIFVATPVVLACYKNKKPEINTPSTV